MSLADDIVTLGSQAPAVVSGIAKIVRTVGPVLPTVQLIFDDPAFPRIVAQIQELHAIEAAKPAAPTVPGAPIQPKVGIGLSRAVPLLDAVIYARRNPWAPWVAAAALVLVIGGVGYRLGSRRR